jgi:hypothetical protein
MKTGFNVAEIFQTRPTKNALMLIGATSIVKNAKINVANILP